MKPDAPTPKELLPPLPAVAPHLQKRHHQWQAALLILAASVIFLAGFQAKTKVRNSEVYGPTIEAMVASLGEDNVDGIDPHQAVFEFKPIDINLADGELLASLQGIGPKIAERIIAYRQERGCFADPEQLLKVKGVGIHKLARIRDELTVGNCPD